MALQQADLAIAVGEAAVRGTQAGSGNVLSLGVQHAGDGDELQRARVHGQKTIVDGEVRAGIQLGLRKDDLTVLVDEFVVRQGLCLSGLGDGVIFHTEPVFTEIVGYFDVAVVLSGQRRTVIFLGQRLDRQACLRDCGLRPGDGQRAEALHLKVVAGIQLLLGEHGIALGVPEFIAADGRHASDFRNRVIGNSDIVFADRTGKQIALVSLHGKRSLVIFLAGVEASQGKIGYRRFLRFR